MSDTKLMIAIGILHLVALGVGGGLLLLAFRGGDGYDHPHAEGGRGPDQPPDPPRRPIGGPPLPSRRERSSPRPRDPMTIRSWSLAFASATIAGPAGPRVRTLVTGRSSGSASAAASSIVWYSRSICLLRSCRSTAGS